MDTILYGRTGLNVSVMGLGCGGPSGLGRKTNKSEAESIAIVRQALDAGVNYLDTAESYQTESMVGAAIRHIDRDQIVISTKKSYRDEISPQLVRQGLEESLRRLGTEYVDIYNLHGVVASDYPKLREEILPTFFDLRDEGKLRFIGVSEMFNEDTMHQMLAESLVDDLWDVVMVGFNLLNQTARDIVFPQTIKQNVAVQVMFAVRRALSQPEKLVEAMQTLIAAEQLDPNEVDLANPLGWVLQQSDASTIVEAAYRFCRYEPGVHVVLSGTGNPEHLVANINALSKPPLPAKVVERLRHIFRNASSVTGQ